MYNEFFGFKEKPFQLIPNPDFFFLGKNHKNALAHLTYAASQGDGFVEITGEVGTGKTTLCRVFLEGLDENVNAAFIFNPRLSDIQLLKAIHEELDIESTGSDIMELTRSLNEYLIHEKTNGKSVILLIDEAQHLGQDTLEQLRLLSNLETTRSKLIQIVLVGQPELAELLDSFDLRQLRQRINLSCILTPLSKSETREYIHHRTSVAADADTSFFTTGAVRKIYKASNGIPRKINIICDRALLTAYSQDSPKITTKIAKIAIDELDFPTGIRPAASNTAPKRNGFFRAVFIVLAIFTALTFFIFPQASEYTSRIKKQAGNFFNTLLQTSDKMPPEQKMPLPEKQDIPVPPKNTGDVKKQEKQPEAKPLPAPAAETRPTDIPKKVPATTDEAKRLIRVNQIAEGTDRNTAVFYLFSLWKKLPEKDIQAYSIPLSTDSEFFRMAAVQNRFLLFHLKHHFSLVERLGFPAILELSEKPGKPASYIILHKITPDGRYVFSSGKFNESYIIDRSMLLKSIGDNMYLACPDIFGPDLVIGPEGYHLCIMNVKMILRQLGYESITLDHEYGPAVETAVKQIQSRYGLNQDGLVGPATKMALYREKNFGFIPLLNAKSLSPSANKKETP